MRQPVSAPATTSGPFHVILPGTDSAAFLLQAGPLGDILPIPFPYVRNVASIGDVFLAVGLAFYLFANTVRTAFEVDEATKDAIRRRLISIAPNRLALDPATAVAVTGRGLGGTATLGGPATVLPIPAIPPILARVRRHPYVRLALDGSFSALWTGQLISLIGDRIHQVAVAFVVLYATGSPIAVGIAFFVATVPNLLFGAVAGTLVDRWDHRETMIVSDLLRASLVLLIPIAASIDLLYIYPMVFLVTTISVFFRPAKGAVLPRLVAPDDLNAANSAMWIAETFADIGGYAVAGIFVALLGPQLPLAFWADAVTYVASAILIASISVAPVAARRRGGGRRGLGLRRRDAGGLDLPAWRAGGLSQTRSRRRSPSSCSASSSRSSLSTRSRACTVRRSPPPPCTASSRAGSEPGNLIGGFLIGLLGSRIALGRMVILGYVFTGGCIAALALTGNFEAAFALTFGAGVGNLAFVIPSQTIVQTRTPPHLMGRLLGLRFTMVFGSMAIATGVGGFLGVVFGVPLTIGFFGLVTVAAGVAGIFVPAVRDA